MRTVKQEWLFAEGFVEYYRQVIVLDGVALGYLQRDGSVTSDKEEADWWSDGEEEALLEAWVQFRDNMKTKVLTLVGSDKLKRLEKEKKQ